MAIKKNDNSERENNIDSTTQKKNSAVLGLFIFVAVVAVIAVIISTVIVPGINKTLNNIGIKSVNEFIDFYKEINAYISESEVVKNPYSNEDYKDACQTLIDSGLNIFDGNGAVKAISEEKIEEYNENGFPDYGTITLTDKELGALMASALKNENIIKNLNIELIETYKLSLEIKELTVTKADEENTFNLKTVGKISLKDVAATLSWPYNGMIPETIYVTARSRIEYIDGVATFDGFTVRINDISERTHRTVIDVVNSQIKDKNIKPLTLESLSENLNKGIYEKIEGFASLLSGEIKIVLDEDERTLFELTYVEKTA